MKNLFIALVSFSVLATLGSCAKALQGMYGMKKYKVLSKEEIATAAAKNKIPADAVYMLDTSYGGYLVQFRQQFTSFTVENHLHPIQAAYYDKNGVLMSYHSGVYADAGLANFRWNIKGAFKQFPPNTCAPLDTMLDFERHLSFVRTLDGDKLDYSKYKTANANVVIHWTRFTGRQSKHLIRLIQRNARFIRKGGVNFLYVNTDNLYQNAKPDY